jgi:thiosulfate reductase/polysulfide reductase chain A
MLCARGQSGIMTTYDPDRITTPLIRVGARGEGKFRRASWDEALDLVAKNMLDIKQKYGAEAMIFSSTHNLSQPLFENLLYGFGSPNYGTQRSLCFNAMVVAHLMTYGLEEPGRDYANVKYIIYTGRNMVEAISTSETSSLMKAIARGARGGARSALYQDGQQGQRVAAHQTRNRSCFPFSVDQCDRHQQALQRRIRRDEYDRV